MTAPTTELDNRVPRWRRWTDLQSLRASLGSGLLGGLCCIAAAITAAAGLGAAGFFSTLMDRYEPYFILVSLAIMALWLFRHLRQGISPRDVRAVLRTVGRLAIVMAIVYVITLGIAMAAAQLIRMRALAMIDSQLAHSTFPIHLVAWLFRPCAASFQERSTR